MTWRKQVKKNFKHIEKSRYNFGGNLRPNYILLYPRLKETIQIQGQIKSKDIIKFLMGHFNLIMG